MGVFAEVLLEHLQAVHDLQGRISCHPPTVVQAVGQFDQDAAGLVAIGCGVEEL
jgi:hypothetical protein